MGTEQKNLDVPVKVTGKTVYGIDVRVARHEVGGREGVPGLWRRREELRLRRDPQHAGRALRRPVPDSRSGADARPHLQRRRRGRSPTPGIKPRPRSIGCRSSGRSRPSTPRSTRRTCTTRSSPRSIEPGSVRVNSGRRGRRVRARRENRRSDLLDAVSAARADGARQRDGARHRRSRRHLDRRSEPAGNALQRVEDHRHPRAERLSAPVPPRRRLRPQRQRASGRAGDHDRERASRHADPSALDARGGFHRHDLSRDGRGAPEGRARRRRLADRARGAHGDAGRRLRPRIVVRRGVALLRAELPLLEPHDEIPRSGRHAARRRAGRARVLSRELHERARARRRQGSVSLSARAHRAHQPAVTKTT